MSAITNRPSYLQDIHSYRTSVKIVLHSHLSKNHIILMQEISEWSCSKQVKAVGNLSFTFVANRNYLNKIFPNDYVNLYVDRADGEGWTRVFFGFVDRIQEDYSVGNDGMPSIKYSVSCSDFAKAFDKSVLYFNPHIGTDRTDFDASWIGGYTSGGIAVRTKGVSSTGSPPDVVLNNIFVMLGASSQFLLPVGFTPRTKDAYRQKRKEFITNRLGKDIIASLPDGASVAEIIKKIDKLIEAKIPLANLRTLLPADDSPEEKQRVAEERKKIEKVYGDKETAATTDALYQYKAALQTADPTVRPSLLDIIDVFTFCEREAIDGFTTDVTIWQKEGSLMSLLMQQSNEVINELFFDLRPVIDSTSTALAAGSNWSRTADEIGQNYDDTKLDAPGVRYVPALIYREYPFSTIDSIDATAVKLSIAGKDGLPLQVGDIQFGAIFSDKPNEKGRHVINVKNINVEDVVLKRDKDAAGNPKLTQKHIDVAVITPSEIISSSLGRSDAEHYNLTQFLTDGLLGESSRFYMHDILPIVNPTGIARNGLRVRELTSSFTRFAEHNIPQLKAADLVPKPEPEPKPEEKKPKETPKTSTDGRAVGFPIDPSEKSLFFMSAYKWRKKPTFTKDGLPFPCWMFHHGIDLGANRGTPVKAVADGYCVAVAKSGTKGFIGYGNTVVIRHDLPYKGHKVYSVYAHLDSIDPALVEKGNPQWIHDKVNGTAKELFPNGRMAPFRIEKGTVVGKVGDTKTADANGNPVNYDDPHWHLHFEITKGIPSKGPGGPGEGYPMPVPWIDKSHPSDEPPAPTEENTASYRSFNPQIWFRDHGIDIEKEVVIKINDEDFGDDKEAEEDEDHKREEVKEEAPDTSSPRINNVDTGPIRSQVARWALLDDHWYQHNIEYLSGTITMRGAPEIRVGYRLDIHDNDIKRQMSFYVEGVQHSWSYPGAMTTTLTVTRGQPNNPFPVYVLPYIKGVKKSADVQRKTGSRLGKFFLIPAPKPSRESVFVSYRGGIENNTENVENPDTNMTANVSKSGELYVPAGGKLDLGHYVDKPANAVQEKIEGNSAKVKT